MYIHKRAVYIRQKRSMYIPKRAVYIRQKRSMFIHKRAVYIRQKALYETFSTTFCGYYVALCYTQGSSTDMLQWAKINLHICKRAWYICKRVCVTSVVHLLYRALLRIYTDVCYGYILYRALLRICYYGQKELYMFVNEIDISAKLVVSEYSLFYRALLQKRPMILDSAKLYVSVCILWAIQGGEDT